MSPVALKVAGPYGQAFFNLCLEKNCLPRITYQMRGVRDFLNSKDSLEFRKCLKNPLISSELKGEMIRKVFKKVNRKLSKDILDFFIFLISRGRISLIQEITYKFLDVVQRNGISIMVNVITAFKLSSFQYSQINHYIQRITKVQSVELITSVDETIIGGILLKTESKILDFTVKNQLQKLAKYLNSTLEI